MATTLATSTQQILEALAREIRQEKESKNIHTRKEEVKLSLFADDLIVHIENRKDSTKKLLEQMNKFSKAIGHKINIHKLAVFGYTNNKISQREVMKTIPYTIASKIIKYLGINLTKEVKHLCTKNYKTLMEEDTNKWKEILYS